MRKYTVLFVTITPLLVGCGDEATQTALMHERQRAAKAEKRISELETQIATNTRQIEILTRKLSDSSDAVTDNKVKLAGANNELREPRARDSKLEDELGKTRTTIAGSEEPEGNRNVGEAVSPTGVAFSDLRGAVTVEILQILTGDQVVRSAKLHAHSLVSIREQKKDVIYFEVKITNNRYDGELILSQYQFQLESMGGDMFSVNQTRDYLRGRVHRGRSARGGIAFALYADSIPKVLRFNTGLRDGIGTRLEAVSPDIGALLRREQDESTCTESAEQWDDRSGV